MLGESQHLHQVQDLMRMETVATDRGQGLLPVNHFLHLHTWIGWRSIEEGEERAHPLGTWEMMQ